MLKIIIWLLIIIAGSIVNATFPPGDYTFILGYIFGVVSQSILLFFGVMNNGR